MHVVAILAFRRAVLTTGPVLARRLVLSGALLLSHHASAGDDSRFDLLVFDPVPLDVTATTVTATAVTATTPPVDAKPNALPAVLEATELATVPREQALPIKLVAEQIAKQSVTITKKVSPDDIAKLEERLNQQEQAGDAFAKPMAETLMDLAADYESTGNYTKSLAMYERANQIVRINKGLFSLDQEPLIRHMIDNHLAQGDIAAADASQAYLFYLRTKAYGRNTPEIIPALQELAQWNITAYRMEAPMPQTPAGEGLTEHPVLVSSDQMVTRLNHLKTANELHTTVVQMLDKPGASTSALSQAEYQFAISNFLFTRMVLSLYPLMNENFADNAAIMGMQDYHSSYADGRTALENRISQLEQSKATPADLAHARVDLADWLIATHTRDTLKDALESAYKDYAASGADVGTLDRLFNPPMPAQVPAFLIYANSRRSLAIPPETALEYRGHIDVEFSVNTLGEARSIKVLYQTPETPPQVSDTLLRSIRRNLFRPRIVDGKLMPYDNVDVRYYYTW
ncbi:MAG TPA: hypothetical protein VMH83_00930 [Candidatus Acidoferrum sp.]|nr:hypothetical protein [Candidatus Acidoferrum sp.]